MSYTYTVEQGTNAVRIFENGSDVPCIYQPDYPNTTPWEDAAAAAAWAELYILSVEDESAPFAPAGPGIPGEPKPTPEEIEAMRAKMQQQGAISQ